MELGGQRELVFTVNTAESEKTMYVDENGENVSEVWKDGVSIDDAENTEEVVEAENIDEASNSEDEGAKYKKEKRIVKTNKESDLTRENFEKTKAIIIERLKNQNISEYNIRLDEITGKMVIETPNNDDIVARVEYAVNQIGKFKMLDYQNGELLMDNSDIKSVSALYSNNQALQAYLEIDFNKKGAQKLKEISTKYVEVKSNAENDNENQDDSNSEESTIYKVVLEIDDTQLITTYFGGEMSNGILQLSIGSATTDIKTFEDSYNNAIKMANILNSGILPIDYELEKDNFVYAENNSNVMRVCAIAAVAAIIIISIVIIAKFKLKGVYACILAIGFIATLSIVSRYTNVLLTVNSLMAYVAVILLNYLLLYSILNDKTNKENFWKELKKFYLNTIPVTIFVLISIFTSHAILNSIGMVGFWGMVLIAVYNIIFTKLLLKKTEGNE